MTTSGVVLAAAAATGERRCRMYCTRSGNNGQRRATNYPTSGVWLMERWGRRGDRRAGGSLLVPVSHYAAAAAARWSDHWITDHRRPECAYTHGPAVLVIRIKHSDSTLG